MSDQDTSAMEATFEDELAQTTFDQLPDTAPASTEEATAQQNFLDDDDDGFGDFEDAAWETAPEFSSPAPALPNSEQTKMDFAPPAAIVAPTSSVSNKKDILSLDPAAFLDTATSIMAPFSPMNTDSHNKRPLNGGSITNLKDLRNKFPPTFAYISTGVSENSWNGSIPQARLLHRLNLGPAPILDSPHLSQPPPLRATLRPSSSGSLYSNSSTPALSFPAPPATIQRSVLAPPPVPRPAPVLLQEQKKIVPITVSQKIDSPRLVPAPVGAISPSPPVPSSSFVANSDEGDDDDTNRVDSGISPLETAPENLLSLQPLTNGIEELTLIEEPKISEVEQGSYTMEPALASEDEKEKEGAEEFYEEEKEEEQDVDGTKEQIEQEPATLTIPLSSSPSVSPSSLPYQNPFISPRTGNETENEKNGSFPFEPSFEEKEEREEEKDNSSYNPFILAGEDEKKLFNEEENSGDAAVLPAAAAAALNGEFENGDSEEGEQEVQEESEEMETEEIEEEDEVDDFNEAPSPAAPVVIASAAEEEWVNPFEAPEEEIEKIEDQLEEVVLPVATKQQEIKLNEQIRDPKQEEEYNDIADASISMLVESDRVEAYAAMETEAENLSSSPSAMHADTTNIAVDSDGYAHDGEILEGEPEEVPEPIILEQEKSAILEEEEEDFTEFEWAEAASPSMNPNTDSLDNSTTMTTTISTVEVIDDVVVKEEISSKEEDNGDENEDEDEFDDFCEADDGLVSNDIETVVAEKEKEEKVPASAAAVAEGVAATLPDLSFMLSDTLVKPNT